MYLYNWKIRPLAIGHKAMGHKAAFCNNPCKSALVSRGQTAYFSFDMVSVRCMYVY